MSNILKQYTKFIFPFQYEKDAVDLKGVQIENKKGVKQNVFEPISIHTESLRDGLDLMLSKDGGKSRIADCYRLNVNCRKHFSLPPKKTDTLTFCMRQAGAESFDVRISELQIYLFESQVGFIEVECEYLASEIDTYMDLNYFICEAKSEKNQFVYHEKIWDEETKTSTLSDVSFSMSELLERVLSAACKTPDAISFDYRKSKPVIYSHVLMDKKPENLEALLPNIANNYKHSYKFDGSTTKIQSFHPFENSYWTSSLNGAVNISFLSDDDVTNDFFTNNFYTKTKNTYFFLFLNVLHQRCAIIRVMGKMGNLDQLTNNYIVMEKELKLARQYELEATSLKFRAFFNLPSTVDHINEYYDRLYKSFQVGTLYSSFAADIENLQSICGKYVDRINERDEKIKKRKVAKMEIFVSIFGVVVAEVSLFNNSWTLIEKVIGRSLHFYSPAILILFLTLLSPIITITLSVSKTLTEIKALSKQLNVEKQDSLVEDDKKRWSNEKTIDRLRKKRSKRKH